jgi:hypothetical protein
MAFISTSDVRLVGVIVLLAGLGSLLVVGRRRPTAWFLAAVGAVLATWGSMLVWESGVTVIDGPDGFSSLSDMMGSTFDSWLWVVVFGVISGLVWFGALAALARRKPRGWTSIAIFGGALLAAASAGLLDSSI